MTLSVWPCSSGWTGRGELRCAKGDEWMAIAPVSGFLSFPRSIHEDDLADTRFRKDLELDASRFVRIQKVANFGHGGEPVLGLGKLLIGVGDDAGEMIDSCSSRRDS